MLKRILSALLVMLMVLSMVPVVVAEEIAATDKAGTHGESHLCESCGAAFTAWTSTTTLPTAGHYYLTGNVTLTKEYTVTGQLHLCLNGYVIRAAAGKRIFSTKGDTATELVLTDCTAYTDETGAYHAGALTGGQDTSAGGGAIFIRRLGVAKIYDGRITGNTSTVAGGAVAMQAKSGSVAGAKLYMYGGELSDNTAIKADGTYKNGGAIYTGSGCVVEMENVALRNNTAICGGAVYTGAMASPIILKNCLLEGNTATNGNTTGNSAGGAIYSAYASIQLSGCALKGNTAPNGGGAAIWAKESGTITLTDSQVLENEAKNAGGAIYICDKVNLNVTGSTFMGNKSGSGGSVLYYQNYCQVSLKDTTVTGNIGTNTSSAGYSAAIYGVGGSSKLTIGGKIIIADNSIKSPNTADLNFNNAATDTLYVDALADGSRVFFSTKATTEAQAADLVSGSPSQWNYNWLTFLDENGQFKLIGYENGAFVFSKGHAHNGCGEADCQDHPELIFKAWTDSTALPTSGSWYLDTDITVSKEVRLTGNLELCLNGHTVTGTNESIRFFSTQGAGGETLTICDCTAQTVDGVYTAGKMTGNVNNNTSAGGGAIFLRAGGVLRLFDGIISDNATVAGGGAVFAKDATIEMYGGQFSGNKAQAADGTWKTGGAIYLQNTTMTIYGGQIIDNEANDGAGIVLTGTSYLDLQGGKVNGNIAHKEGAGVFVAAANSGAKLSGDPVITGNTLADGSASNLCLRDGNLLELGQLAETAVIGLSAAPFQTVSGKTQDYTANVVADHPLQVVLYQDEALYMGANSDHNHCLCGGKEQQGCDHQGVSFMPWSDPAKLPSFGNYYLTVDVTVEARTNLENAELKLCLNGHSITVGQQGGRIYRMYSGAHLYLTDCTQTPGMLTGATQGAILSDQDGTDMSISFWNIAFTGNHAQSAGGAIVAQGDTTVNMYSGKITDNSSIGYLKLDENGQPILDEKGNQTYATGYGAGLVVLGDTAVFNMYDGEISGNRTEAVAYKKADGNTAYAGGYGGGIHIRGTANLYGGVIKENQARTGGGVSATGSTTQLHLLGTEICDNRVVSGGGVILQSGAKGTMSAGKITGNRASDSGAGIYLSTGTQLVMTDGYIGGNTADKNGGGMAISGKETKLTIQGGSVSDNRAKNAGGVYSQTYATLELHGGKINDNYASASGGGIYSATNATLVMTGGSVNGNATGGDVGGIMCLRGTAKLTGGSVSYNTAVNAGGMCIYGSQATLIGLSVVGNRAVGKPTVDAATGKTTYTGGNSGGIMIRNSSMKVNGVNTPFTSVVYAYGIYVADNKSNTAAGGLLIQSSGAQLYLYDSTFIRNESATSDGGAMYLATGVKVNMENVTVTENKAPRAAGMNIYGCEVKINGLKLFANQSKNGGGGLAVVGKSSNVHVDNAQIHDNIAGGAGGALVIQTGGYLKLTNSKVYGNTTDSQGGACYFNSPSTAVLENVEIYENTADNNGGGLHLHVNASVTLNNVTLRNNTADGSGGAVFCRGRLVATGSKFLNNKAEQGGAIATNLSSGDVLRDEAGVFLTGGVLSGNESATQGGAVYNHRGGPVYLTDCILTENIAGQEGSAIYSNGRFGLTDVTVTGNTGNYAIYVTGADYDGHSYTTGHKKLGGEMIVRDNTGGDLYLCENALLTVVGESLGEKTHVDVTLENGEIRQYVQGVYGYEGENLHYILTAGNRSITDYPEPIPEETQPVETQPTTAPVDVPAGTDNTMLYVAIGGVAAVLLLAAVLVVVKKKKSGKAVKE